MQPDLGLSQKDYSEITQNVNLVISNAADVKWDTPLTGAIKANIDGPLYI